VVGLIWIIIVAGATVLPFWGTKEASDPEQCKTMDIRSKYEFGEVLGTGAFSTVQFAEGKPKGSNHFVAVKCIDKKRDTRQRRLT